MNNINWDKLFEQDCESMPNCPWIDHKPIKDSIWDWPDDDDEEEMTEREKKELKDNEDGD